MQIMKPHHKPFPLCYIKIHVLWIILLMCDFVTLYIDHLENSGSSYAELLNADTFYYTEKPLTFINITNLIQKS